MHQEALNSALMHWFEGFDWGRLEQAPLQSAV